MSTTERGPGRSDSARLQGPRPGSTAGRLDAWFHVTERGSTVRTEALAGLVTFATMAYILFLNPAILGAVADRGGTKLAPDQVLTVTALVAGTMTLLMGAYANYPFALAAGLGLNAFVAFSLVGNLGLSWPQAMGVILVEGLVIAAAVLTGLREAILEAIPRQMKQAISVGIGLFITFIGLVDAGVVLRTQGGGGPVQISRDLASWKIGVFVFGLLLTGALVARRIRGSLLIGVVAATVLAILINNAVDRPLWTNGVADVPSKWVATPDFALVGNVSFGFFDVLGFGSAVAVILAVLLSDFFDTMGTVIGLAGKANLLDRDGRLPGVRRVLLVDSAAAAVGGAASSSSNTTYIESASGIAEGGRTGLTSVVTGLLFLVCLWISPLAGVLPPEATAPALVVVGSFLMANVADIDWVDPGIALPALLTIVVMPFTYSITNGIGAGVVAYVAIAVLRGRPRDVHPLMLGIAALFVWYFVHGVV